MKQKLYKATKNISCKTVLELPKETYTKLTKQLSDQYEKVTPELKKFNDLMASQIGVDKIEKVITDNDKVYIIYENDTDNSPSEDYDNFLETINSITQIPIEYCHETVLEKMYNTFFKQFNSDETVSDIYDVICKTICEDNREIVAEYENSFEIYHFKNDTKLFYRSLDDKSAKDTPIRILKKVPLTEHKDLSEDETLDLYDEYDISYEELESCDYVFANYITDQDDDQE